MAIERTATVKWEGDLFKGKGSLSSQSGALGDKSLEVQAVVALDRTDDGLKIVSSTLTARGRADGATEESFAEAARSAESTCPVSNALRDNVAIELETSLAG